MDRIIFVKESVFQTYPANSSLPNFILLWFPEVEGYGLIDIHSDIFTEIVRRCTDDFEMQMMNIRNS